MQMQFNIKKQVLLRFINSYLKLIYLTLTNCSKQCLFFIKYIFIKLAIFNRFVTAKFFFSVSLLYLFFDFSIFINLIDFLTQQHTNQFSRLAHCNFDLTKFTFFFAFNFLFCGTIIFFIAQTQQIKFWFESTKNEFFSFTAISWHFFMSIFQLFMFSFLFYKLYYFFSEYFLWGDILISFFLYCLSSVILVNFIYYLKKINFNNFVKLYIFTRFSSTGITPVNSEGVQPESTESNNPSLPDNTVLEGNSNNIPVQAASANTIQSTTNFNTNLEGNSILDANNNNIPINNTATINVNADNVLAKGVGVLVRDYPDLTLEALNKIGVAHGAVAGATIGKQIARGQSPAGQAVSAVAGGVAGGLVVIGLGAANHIATNLINRDRNTINSSNSNSNLDSYSSTPTTPTTSTPTTPTSTTSSGTPNSPVIGSRPITPSNNNSNLEDVTQSPGESFINSPVEDILQNSVLTLLNCIGGLHIVLIFFEILLLFTIISKIFFSYNFKFNWLDNIFSANKANNIRTFILKSFKLISYIRDFNIFMFVLFIIVVSIFNLFFFSFFWFQWEHMIELYQEIKSNSK